MSALEAYVLGLLTLPVLVAAGIGAVYATLWVQARGWEAHWGGPARAKLRREIAARLENPDEAFEVRGRWPVEVGTYWPEGRTGPWVNRFWHVGWVTVVRSRKTRLTS